jgi:hypothetical protein
MFAMIWCYEDSANKCLHCVDVILTYRMRLDISRDDLARYVHCNRSRTEDHSIRNNCLREHIWKRIRGFIC